MNWNYSKCGPTWYSHVKKGQLQIHLADTVIAIWPDSLLHWCTSKLKGVPLFFCILWNPAPTFHLIFAEFSWGRLIYFKCMMIVSSKGRQVLTAFWQTKSFIYTGPLPTLGINVQNTLLFWQAVNQTYPYASCWKVIETVVNYSRN